MSQMQKLQLFVTPAHGCSYLTDRSARMLFVDPQEPVSFNMLSELSRQGFRRSGDFVYKPDCKHCRQCMSVRVPVALFKPNKSQKRTTKYNADLTQTLIKSSDATAQHYELYAKYINERHYDGDMYPPSVQQFKKFLVHGCADSMFLEFWHGTKLVCVSVCDVLDDGISAVYTFFDPAYEKRSLGTYAILQQIQWMQQEEKDFVYLGYWVPEAPKMKYKSNFMPLDMMINNRWHRVTRKFTETDVGKLLIAINASTNINVVNIQRSKSL